jgi:hypothetical protein
MMIPKAPLPSRGPFIPFASFAFERIVHRTRGVLAHRGYLVKTIRTGSRSLINDRLHDPTYKDLCVLRAAYYKCPASARTVEFTDYLAKPV